MGGLRWSGRLVALLPVLVLVLPPGAGAADLVVPDDVATIQGALDIAGPGDTISVRGDTGPWVEKITFPTNGTPGFPITLRAFPGDSPILDGTGIPGANMVLIDSRSHVRLIGFEIRNDLGVNDGSGVRIIGSGTDIEIRDNRIHDIRGRDAMGITVYGTEATSISGLVIDGNEIFDVEPARSEALTLNGNVEQFAVTNNVVRDVNNIGIDFIGGETDIQPDPTKVVRDGVCADNVVMRARSSYGGGFAGGIYVDGGRDIVIERNVVTESDLGIEIGAENAGISTTGIVVRDNVVYRNDKVGIVFGGFAAAVGRVRDSFFLNNTLWENDMLGAGFGELWIQYAEDNVVRQNVFQAGAGGVLTYSESGNVSNLLDWNLWWTPAGPGAAAFVWQGTGYPTFAAFQAGSGQGGNSSFADPLLLAPGAGDFHLASTSPAVDGGDPAFVPAAGETDLDGAPRVSGSRVDLGADEVTCGDGVQDPGETCDDGDLVDCDGCDSNCTPSGTCGNGVACAPEACDDGNAADGDCCSATCAFEPAAAPCDDGALCTSDDACDGAGACAGIPTPASVCRAPTAAGKSLVMLRENDVDRRDLLLWRWARGAATAVGALGDPTAGTRYAVCLYDGSGAAQPLVGLAVPTGGAWKATNRGYRYAARAGGVGGLRRVKLLTGGAGKAKTLVRAKGADVPLPTLGLVSPVTLQLRNDQGECWGATFSQPDVNDAARFRARSD